MGVNYKDLFAFENENTEITDLLCTTMSLEIDEQLRIIGCLHNEDRIIVGDKQYELLKNDINRCYFFYDERKSNIHPSDTWNSAIAFTALHAMQYPVRLDKANMVFHPKIVLLRFTEADEIGYRLQVSSRNITSTNSFEAAVQLVGRRKKEENRNHNVDELLRWFVDNLEYLTEPQKNHLNELAEELKKYQFEIPLLENSEVSVRVSGIGGDQDKQQDKQLVDIWQKEEQTLEKKLYILSPDYETDKKQIEGFHRVYAPVSSLPEENFDAKPRWMSTHAKIYFYPEDDRVWIGSCNSSKAALLGGNVECMVSIKFDRIQEYISINNTDNSITVFGEKCLRVEQGKERESNLELELASKLSSFLLQVNQTGSDWKNTMRSVWVKFQAKNPKKISEVQDTQKYKLECLPVGFPDKKNDGQTKWEVLSLGKKLSFQGRRKDSPNGLLRVRLTRFSKGEKSGSVSSERIIVIDEDARKNATLQIESLDSSFFIQHKWLEEMMKLDTKEEIKNEYHMFIENLKIVRKIPLSNEQQEYLNGLELVMRKYISSKGIEC